MMNIDGNAPRTYKCLIGEAYIEPIRTVTIVDDDYPTLESTIKNHFAEEKTTPWLDGDLTRLQELITLCRDKKHSWAVDVYDGSCPAIKEIDHVKHSDLVILDYHLDKSDAESGEKALECIGFLATNNHFNLVIIHTKGSDGNDINTVFLEILSSLMKAPALMPPEDIDIDEINEFMDTVGDDDPYVLPSMLGKTNIFDAIKVCEDSDLNNLFYSPSSAYSHLRKEIEQIISGQPDIKGSHVIWWLVSKTLNKHQSSFTQKNHGLIQWGHNEDCNWIASGTIFLTVVKKEPNAGHAKELPDKLLNALESFRPAPMLLLMARMRYELEEYGFSEATEITEQKDLQTAWLYELLSAPKETRNSICDHFLENHWDRIASSTKLRLHSFTKELVSSFDDQPPKDVVEQFFGKNNPMDSIAALNSYRCSKDISESHLSTGHVIEIEVKSKPEYWICLSPLCDLVPGQKKKGWHGRVGVETMPFKAVKLIAVVNMSTAISGATTNKFIFLKIGNKVTPFEIPDGKSGNPDWEQMFSEKSGLFSNKNHELSILRVEAAPTPTPPKPSTPISFKERLRLKQSKLKAKKIDLDTHKKKNQIITTRYSAKIVGQLRYEYALNQLQRLAGTLSRVGLNFIDRLW